MIIGRRNNMPSKEYKSVSIPIELYDLIKKMSNVVVDDTKVSITKTIEISVREKAKKMNGKLSG